MNKKTISIYAFIALLIIWLILIKTNLIEPFDLSVYNMLAANINPNLTSVFKSLTILGEGISIAIFCLISLAISFIMKKRNVGIIIAACVTFNSLFSEVLKRIIQRPRPEIMQLVNETSYSFPSSHTLASVSLCGIIIYIILKSKLDQKIKIILTILLSLLPILIGISRVYLGAHYASDILGGAILAILLLLIEISIIEKKEYL